MFKNNKTNDLLLIITLLVVSRLIPHWPNVTALGATAILAPRWFKDHRLVLVAPLLALLVSDLFIGFHNTMFFTYGAVLLVSWLSFGASHQGVEKAEGSGLGAREMFGWSLFSSVLFYLITNFGAWMMLDMYPKTISGLWLSYWNAIPFFGYELLGTLFYLGLAQLFRKLWVNSKPLKSVINN